MVFGLSSNFDQAEGAVGVGGGGAQHVEEAGLVNVVGAGAGDEHASGAEHLQVTAAFAIDEEDGVVGFEAGIQSESTLARLARAGNTQSPNSPRRRGMLLTKGTLMLTLYDAPGQLIPLSGRVFCVKTTITNR